MASLLVTHGHHFGVTYQLTETTTLGRSSGCTIQLLDEKASRIHATIRHVGDQHVLRDEGSSNGTGLNGRLLLEPHALKPGDQIAVGSNILVFESDMEIYPDLEGTGSVILVTPKGAQAPLDGLADSGERGFHIEDLLARVAETLSRPRGTVRPSTLVETVVRGLGGERGALLLMPEGGEPVKAVATYPHRGRVTISRSLLRRARERRSSVLAGDGVAELVAKAKSGCCIVETQSGAALAVPIAQGDELRGLFYADSIEGEAFLGLPMGQIEQLVCLTFGPMFDGRPESVRPLREHAGLREPIAESAAMQAVMQQVNLFLNDSGPLMFSGEAGTGKLFMAQWVHGASPRRRGPFVPVHCAELSENIAESSLFGHEPGAVHGANSRHRGAVERADGGTLFLDGIASLNPSLQVKLLRTLQEGRFYRRGGTRPVRADLRLITGTERNLVALVHEGEFRGDLFGILSQRRVHLPPLRQRLADLGSLVTRFVECFNERTCSEMVGVQPMGITQMENFDWPGNLQQLEDFVTRSLVGAASDQVSAQEVQAELNSMTMASRNIEEARAEDSKRLERRRIERVLSKTHGNKRRSAAMLGLSRAELDRRIIAHALRHLIE